MNTLTWDPLKGGYPMDTFMGKGACLGYTWRIVWDGKPLESIPTWLGKQNSRYLYDKKGGLPFLLLHFIGY